MPPWSLKAFVLFLSLSGSATALMLLRKWRSWHHVQSASTPACQSNRMSIPVMTAGKVEASQSGTATIFSSVINLYKMIVGAGVLALAAGVAAFSAAPVAVLPGLAVVFFLGSVSAYAFTLVARASNEVGAETYRDIWAKLIGERTAIIPALAVAFKTSIGGLSFSIILGDAFASIASLTGLPAIMCNSNTWIVALSTFVLLPLSLMRNLSSLAIGSLIGTIGTLYTAAFMLLRFADKSYSVGGKFFEVTAEGSRPFFAAHTASNPLINPSIFVLISMLATNYLCHYNAPKLYQELAPPADGSSKDKAFTKVALGGFGLAALVSGLMMAAGYLTFGGAAQGLILNSYAVSDPLAFVARLGICASVLFSYPLLFVGLRTSVLNLFKLDGSKNSVHIISTLLLLGSVNGLSLVIKDLGMVVAVGGAALGSAVVYTFPALFFIQAMRQKKKALEAQGQELPAGCLREMYGNYGLVALGILLSVIGVKVSLHSALH